VFEHVTQQNDIETAAGEGKPARIGLHHWHGGKKTARGG